MKSAPRPPLDAESPERLAILLLTAFSLLAALAVIHMPDGWIPVCAWHRLTGHPCPTCGSVRSLRLLAAGRLTEAWRMQPLVVSLLGGVALWSLYRGAVRLGWIPRLGSVRAPRWLRWTGAALFALLVLLNWIYLWLDGR